MSRPVSNPAAALGWPDHFSDEAHLEDFMRTPSLGLTGDFRNIKGDILILGVGGKMGPTLARLARRAAPDRRVIGVARFSERVARKT